MYRVGLDWPWVTHAIMGPFGVVLLLGLRCVPFTYLAITAALAGLGQEFEDAARVHGAGRSQALRLIIADPGPGHLVGARDRLRRVDQRLRRGGHARLQLELHPGHLPAVRGDRQLPAQLPAGRGDGLAAGRAGGDPARRSRRGRCAAGPTPMLSGRTRQAVRRRLTARAASRRPARSALFFVVTLGIPGFGAVSGSLLGDYGGSFSSPWPTTARSSTTRAARAARAVAGVRHHHGVGHRLPRLHRGPAALAAADSGDRDDGLPAARRGGAAQRGVRRGLHLRLQPADHVQPRHQPLPDRARCWSSPTSRRACRPTRGCWSARSRSCSPR